MKEEEAPDRGWEDCEEGMLMKVKQVKPSVRTTCGSMWNEEVCD